MKRLTVPLKQNEKQALFQLAESKTMDPRHLARLIIRQTLKKLGLVENTQKSTDKRGSQRC